MIIYKIVSNLFERVRNRILTFKNAFRSIEFPQEKKKLSKYSCDSYIKYILKYPSTPKNKKLAIYSICISSTYP